MTAVIDLRRWLSEHPGFAEDDVLSRAATPPAIETGAIRVLDAGFPDPPRWRVQSLHPDGDFGIIAGEDGTSKTTFALHQAAAVAGGYNVLNVFRTIQGPVLFVSEEDDLGTILIRLNALILGHEWDRDRVLANFYVMALEGVNVGDREWQSRLHDEVIRIGAAMLILDPLAELIDGDENDNSAVRPVLKWIRSLPCATVVVHHFGKANEGRSDGDRIRGASAWRRGARTILALESLGDSDRIRVKHLKLTKARKQPTFVFKRSIESDPENEANWVRATLEYESERRARSEGARAWVLSRLDASESGLLSTELRQQAIGSGYTAEDVGAAVRDLAESGEGDRIEHHRLPDDRHNARRWRRRLPF